MVDERSCTDCWMCPLFILFLGGMVFAFFYGVIHGKPYMLLTPFDVDGNGCGYSEGYGDYPKMYWPEIGDTSGAEATTD